MSQEAHTADINIDANGHSLRQQVDPTIDIRRITNTIANVSTFAKVSAGQILPTGTVTLDSPVDVVKSTHGDLDPQTGLFFATMPSSQSITVTSRDRPACIERQIHTMNQRTHNSEELFSKMVVTESSTVAVGQPSATQPLDLLSSSLAQAQIDLDSYEFVEEAVESYTPSAGDTNMSDALEEGEGNVGNDSRQHVSSTGDVVDFATMLLGETESAEELDQAESGKHAGLLRANIFSLKHIDYPVIVDLK